MVEGVDEAIARVRTAVPQDNQFLIDLMARVPMEGSLVVSTQRGPDFFSLYDLQRGASRAFVYDDGSFAGMAALLVRDGWLDGAAQKVGYLGDLRLRGTGRARRAFPAMFGHFFQREVERTGCVSFLTGVIASNALAIQSLARRKKRRSPQPYYHLFREFEMASVQMVWRRRARIPSGLWVGSATAGDVSALSDFLHEDHRKRPFGYRFDDGELEHRLQRWPGFTLADTLVARTDDERGRIVGCATLWDPSPVKRYRVERYAGDMKMVKLAVSLASRVTGCPRLPEAGEDFRSLYLTNLSVADENPVVLRALLERAYEIAWAKGVHFFSLPLYGKNDPWAPALKGFVVRKLAFHLYAVTASDVGRTEWPDGRPGFEMALA
jgi:GNAT superfamily N-acetyltransferase